MNGIQDGEKKRAPIWSIDRVKETRLVISIPLLLALTVGVYQAGSLANAEYIHWHDTRYAKRSEIMTLAQAQEVKKLAEANRDTLVENATKLGAVEDTVVLMRSEQKAYFAIETAREVRKDLDAVEAKPANTNEWRTHRDKLRRQLVEAVEYRDCVLAGKPSCDILRPDL